MLKLILLFVCISSLQFAITAERAVSDLIMDIYRDCLRDFSTQCVQPKAAEWAREVSNDDLIRITDDLVVEKVSGFDQQVSIAVHNLLIEKSLLSNRYFLKVGP